MKAERPRDLALRILNGLEHRPNLSVNYLDDQFQRNPILDDRDRAFISNLVQGVLRYRLRLDWVIDLHADIPLSKIAPIILNILRLALYQIFFLDRVPESAAVNEAVNQTKANRRTRHVASFVNGILRTICRQKGDITFPDRDKEAAYYLAVYYSYPEWLVNKWIKELGIAITEEMLSAQNRIPALNIRTNTIKISRTGLINRLAEEGITGKPTPYSPEGIVLEGLKGRVDRLSTFREGMFQVQDQAAQITSHLLAPQSGDAVLDICAGLGGKSTHMAELMGGNGSVLALDIDLRRLINLGQNSQRLGIADIPSLVADASSNLSSMFRSRFDRIMVDAPCSGLGVISRHPDGKWNRDERDIIRLAHLQKTLLKEASSVLKRGGWMLYVTCTISREENEEVVEAFLESDSDIVLEDLKEHVPKWGPDLINDQCFFKTFPHIHHMDGFFAALFSKR
ncbi:MAG: 16S rRNA (cytosine(967)-C(5))-methyltransferase RsmB [Deltaproteobacteria bacterium]|nr:16S rRNA (cytosine(967)-C(5))-methyltransferase RsmB [Deltaproteobacteria bacterium]